MVPHPDTDTSRFECAHHRAPYHALCLLDVRDRPYAQDGR